MDKTIETIKTLLASHKRDIGGILSLFTALGVSQGWFDDGWQNFLLGLSAAVMTGGWGHAGIKARQVKGTPRLKIPGSPD